MITSYFLPLSDACMDLKFECKKWANEGKCLSDKVNMDKECPNSCKTCKTCTSKYIPSPGNTDRQRLILYHLSDLSWDD